MRIFFATIVAVSGLMLAQAAHGQMNTAANREARAIFQQLIEINTTDSVGDVTKAAEAMAKRLLDAGFAQSDVIVAGPNERKKNLVARYHGTGKRAPILFIGHLDVVEARREDWSVEPFQFIESNGNFYGRGTRDMKSGDAILVETFARLKREGYRPDRDLILALTADEEGGDYNGIDWLIKEHRNWIDAQYCINLDGGEFEKLRGKRILAGLQASEKVYADYQLETTNPGGHSSVPGSLNAIYELAEALTRLEKFSFPVHINEVTRGYFLQSASLTTGQLSADLHGAAKQPPDATAIQHLSAMPYYNSLLRTTCVATMLTGGHAANALPQMARATVNCRIFPGEDPEEIRKTLERVANDPGVKVTLKVDKTSDGRPIPAVTVPPSPLIPEVTSAYAETLGTMWPGLPVVPTMSTGASDGKYLRIAGIPTFGIACMFFDMEDDRSHGKDERVEVQDFYDGVEFGYRFVKTLSGEGAAVKEKPISKAPV
ncbi:MAG TPA: M20/M25/M40 family metallo-hydrolase [Candidatus Saccharimonadales bacterium]|nr:M20/M25/M40 family metallo-hydrolase [Candidatus Saccharimonadales bacterium]